MRKCSITILLSITLFFTACSALVATPEAAPTEFQSAVPIPESTPESTIDPTPEVTIEPALKVDDEFTFRGHRAGDSSSQVKLREKTSLYEKKKKDDVGIERIIFYSREYLGYDVEITYSFIYDNLVAVEVRNLNEMDSADLETFSARFKEEMYKEFGEVENWEGFGKPCDSGQVFLGYVTENGGFSITVDFELDFLMTAEEFEYMGFKFGDSSQKVIEMMGQEPTEIAEPLFFNIDTTLRYLLDVTDGRGQAVAFYFKDDKLKRIDTIEFYASLRSDLDAVIGDIIIDLDCGEPGVIRDYDIGVRPGYVDFIEASWDMGSYLIELFVDSSSSIVSYHEKSLFY